MRYIIVESDNICNNINHRFADSKEEADKFLEATYQNTVSVRMSCVDYDEDEEPEDGEEADDWKYDKSWIPGKSFSVSNTDGDIYWGEIIEIPDDGRDVPQPLVYGDDEQDLICCPHCHEDLYAMDDDYRPYKFCPYCGQALKG